MQLPITLSIGQCVTVSGDWRIHAVEGDPVLYGVFKVAEHDYLIDGKPLTCDAPRIASVVAL